MNTSSTESNPKDTERLPTSTGLVFDPVSSLWKLMLVVGIAGLLASGSLNFFLLKQNRMLMFQRKQQAEQLQRIQQSRNALRSLLQDVANFSAQYPEARGILVKYGITVNPPVASPPPPPNR